MTSLEIRSADNYPISVHEFSPIHPKGKTIVFAPAVAVPQKFYFNLAVYLADKGFPRIEQSVNDSGAILVMPPFKSKNRQFSQRENRQGYECTSVRIHVERAIERMKRFEILSFIPNHLIKNMDEILIVIGFLCNNYPDLIQ